MAPGLNGRQTGTVPKNKPRNSGTQSNRSAREALCHSSSLDWEPVSEPGSRPRSRRKSSTTHSDAEADSLRYDGSRSRSSTMTSQQHLVDNDNGEVSWLTGIGPEDPNASSRPASHRGRQVNMWTNNQSGSNVVENGTLPHEGQPTGNRISVPDRKQVMNKLTQIQDYIQQTATLMNALKTSDSAPRREQYEKLSVMQDDLKDSESKLKTLLNNMDRTESRIDELLTDLDQLCIENGDSRRMQRFTQIVNEHYGPVSLTNMSNNNNNNADAATEEELVRRSEESKKKLDALQKRKQDLMELQEKARRQLQEAQAEQGRLMARAGCLNQEIATNRLMDLNVQQLNQRLKNVQQVYNARNQINESLAEHDRTSREEAERPDEDQAELSDTETDFQLVRDKMAELNAMKAQLAQIQKLMTTVSQEQNEEDAGTAGEELNVENVKDQLSQLQLQQQHEKRSDLAGGDNNNNAIKLEQAKSKLSQLSQLLEIVQTAQNTTGLSPSYLQIVSNIVNDEGESSVHSASPSCSGRSQPRRSEEMSVETMQVMTRELEERTAAMKEERDRLIAARQQLQNMARRLPMTKPDQILSPDEDSEGEPPCLLAASLEGPGREILNATTSTDTEQMRSFEDSSYASRVLLPRTRPRGVWNTPSQSSASAPVQERRCKNDQVSRGSNQSPARGSARGGTRSETRGSHRDQARWSPSPSASFCDVGLNPTFQTQSQLEMAGSMCDRMLTDSLGRGTRSSEVLVSELCAQHQMLTRTVAQCSQLLWLQQNQIMELRNAMMLQQTAMLQNPPTQPPPMPNHPLPNNQSQYPPLNVPSQNVKLNAGDMQNAQMAAQFSNDFSESLFPQPGQPIPYPVPPYGYDLRYAGYNRFNPSSMNSASNANPNPNQNASASLNNRIPTGMGCLGPEDSGALNNQVPPGNRANNYWDNFRSYSRQNLLSNTKSNEETDSSRRTLDRIPREGSVSAIAPGVSQPANHAVPEGASHDPSSIPSNHNTRANHSHMTRSRSVEPQSLRNSVKNESRSQENDTRNFNTGARVRNPDENIRSVRNDVGPSGRNADNVNASRNLGHSSREVVNDEVVLVNNKRLDKSRSRNEGRGNLNNRSDINNGLFVVLRDNVYLEVTNFIRANENRPHFLIQLFRDLQQVTTDTLRQRTLQSIQETVNANNLTERSISNGSNVNIIENRNNIRENRSNLNRNQTEEPGRIDELFFHLRENQNTIRQNMGSGSGSGSVRESGNSRNNLENEGLRDLRTYFEANLCNFGHNSTLENPNLSNIRENLTRRGPNVSDYENMNPKNVYLSMYDNIVEDLRRRNQDSTAEFVTPFENYRNFEMENDYIPNESNRMSNNQFAISGLESNFEMREENLFSGERRPSSNRFSLLDRGDDFINHREFNDSGIDINFNNADRKRNFLDSATSCEQGLVAKENESMEEEEEGAVALLPSDWDRSSLGGTSFMSSLSMQRIEPIVTNCRGFHESDNGDLAEADQSRNEEAHSGAESDSGFLNIQPVEPESNFALIQNQVAEPECEAAHSSHLSEPDSTFAGEVMEPEGNFFLNSPLEPEGDFRCENLERVHFTGNGISESMHQIEARNSSLESDQSGLKYRKWKNEDGTSESTADFKKGPMKNPTNKFRDNTSGQGKSDNLSNDELETQRTDSDAASAVEGCARTESRESMDVAGALTSLLAFQDDATETDRKNMSPEADADWEMENGLDQVPTRLEKNEKSPRKPA